MAHVQGLRVQVHKIGGARQSGCGLTAQAFFVNASRMTFSKAASDPHRQKLGQLNETAVDVLAT